MIEVSYIHFVVLDMFHRVGILREVKEQIGREKRIWIGSKEGPLVKHMNQAGFIENLDYILIGKLQGIASRKVNECLE